MLATVSSATLLGAAGSPITVEAHVTGGLPCCTIVGLPDAACREARDRVRAAVVSSGFTWPMRRVTVNLAPGGLQKVGSGLDLAIAAGVLAASDQLPPEALEGVGLVGELGLDGALRPVPGIVPLVHALDTSAVVVPRQSVHDARLVGGRRVRSAATLTELVLALRGEAPWPSDPAPPDRAAPPPSPELADVRGQELARLALTAAAAGRHHLLMVGTPGAGKTMLASRLVSLLPDLAPAAALEVTMIHSAAGQRIDGLIERPPLRAPHHSSSMVALIGGGTASMRPGELSLAHQGVLFLDELCEFSPSVLDALRQPLEERVVRVARARASVEFPADVLLVAAMNPCPCGAGGPAGSCACSDVARQRYLRRLSGPILDRFDLRVVVRRPDPDDLLGAAPAASSADVRSAVAGARALATERGVRANAELSAAQLDEVAPIDGSTRSLFRGLLAAGALSARGLQRVRRVARTLADLDGSGPVDERHVALALQLRAPLEVAR